MNSQSENGIIINKAELRTERAVLEECIRSYDRLIGLMGENPEQPIVLHGDSDRSAAIAQIESLTASLREVVSEDAAKPTIRASASSFGRLRRLILVCAIGITVSVVVGWWWMYYRPVQLACDQLQGSWQQFDLNDAGETGRQYYRTFEGDRLTTSDYIQYDDTWREYGRMVELRPAIGFFELKMTGTSEDRPVAGAEFYIQIEGDKINEIRGIHRLDPMHKTVINLWRRVDFVPKGTLSFERDK